MSSADQTVLLTGATSGLGEWTARQLAGKGVTVLLHGRNEQRCRQLAAELTSAGGRVHPVVADLSSLAATADLGRRIAAEFGALTVLVNNAGVGGGRPDSGRELSQDGYELRYAVNYLAPVVLSRALVPTLRANRPARIVNVGSVGQSEPDLSDLRMDRGYDRVAAYTRSKFALAAFTFDLAEELQGTGVTVNCLHPANFMDTPQVREAGIQPWSTVESGGEPLLALILGPAGAEVTGGYFDGKRKSRAHTAAYDPAVRGRLRETTDALIRKSVPHLG
ncbi:SDR family NAD(P)-dependent oxidoreductase [Kitasatospora azatica]|uniref:SDR family NAD(P)-dependent oxidoreductase n=1 Tax=Kitasatospora azatica TaxID=58347 RepID=UPI00055FA1FF|nr:SDR family NAD(P)-dependent oxidoreductase [Kitasatospora azatica]